MRSYEEDVIKLLTEIKELLTPISAHYGPEYIGTKQKQLKEFLATETKRKIFSLLFDPNNLSQTDIAKLADTTQPSVSRLIASLLEAGLIEKDIDENGKEYFIEKFKLSEKPEAKNE
ncbi:MAG: winged helix-turn-helix domain-containing protein [Anaerolineales bacterium]